MPATTRYILYARKSTDNSDRQVQSIDDQLAELRNLAAKRGLTVACELIEKHSAKSPGERPVFNEMLAKIRRGEADGILAWHLNRISRNPVDGGHVSWLLQTGVLKSILTPLREYLSSDNVLLLSVEQGAANQEIIDLRLGVRRGLEGKVRRGMYPYRPKAGYQVDPITKDHVPDPARFHLLKRAWDMLLTGSYSGPRILERINAMGYRTRRSLKKGDRPLLPSGLYQMFSDPFYCGYFQFEGELMEGTHQPMVTKEQFKQAQIILGREIRPKPKSHEFAFTGLIQCGVCGAAVTGERKWKHYPKTGNSRLYTYYRCGRNGCPKRAVTESDFEAVLLQDLERVRLAPEFVDWALGVLEREHGELRIADEAISQERHQLTRGIRAKLDRLSDRYLEGDYSPDEFRETKSRLQAELNRVHWEQETQEVRTRNQYESARNLLCFTRDAYARVSSNSLEQKKAVARTFGASYTLTLGSLEIQIDPRLDKLLSLEPANPRSHRHEVGDSAGSNSDWWALLHHVRTCAELSNEVFPALPEPDIFDH
ncbi:MAG: recombinase family protein [Armatimonadetes bacterium]|nr:recombinase family protein [Armatimonadota bacterium]